MRSRNLSIKHKLTRLIMLTTGAALALACVALVGYDMVTYRATLIRSLSILTEVVGENSIGALTFEDSGAASDALAVLRAEPQVVSVMIRVSLCFMEKLAVPIFGSTCHDYGTLGITFFSPNSQA